MNAESNVRAIALNPPDYADVMPFEPVDSVMFRELYEANTRPVDAVPTMIPTWNQACRDAGGGVGLARGWHITLGACTGNGKSLFALNLVARAVQHGEHVGFVSLEMTHHQLITRLLAIASGVSVRSIEPGEHFSLSEFKTAVRIYNERADEAGGKVYVNNKNISKLRDVQKSIRYLAGQMGCRYIVTDYLQLCHVEGRGSLFEKIEEVSHVVRDTCREMNVVSVALSQFNRETSGNRQVPPSPQGLMGGSPLENDSDQVILLDHSSYQRDPRDPDIATTRLLVGKNRHGPQREIGVRWDYRCLRLTEVQPVERPAEPPRRERSTRRGEAWEPGAASDTTFPAGEAT